jgi:hypothetical protein
MVVGNELPGSGLSVANIPKSTLTWVQLLFNRRKS